MTTDKEPGVQKLDLSRMGTGVVAISGESYRFYNQFTCYLLDDPHAAKIPGWIDRREYIDSMVVYASTLTVAAQKAIIHWAMCNTAGPKLQGHLVVTGTISVSREKDETAGETTLRRLYLYSFRLALDMELRPNKEVPR